MPHPTCSSSLLIMVSSLLLVQFSQQNDLQKVNFLTSGGSAGASSSLRGFPPMHAFETSNVFWHSAGNTVPASVWWEFPEPIRVVQFSFKSRDPYAFGRPRDDPYILDLTVQDGPSKYDFWGSNHHDCSDVSYGQILYREISGTPFTLANEPKKASFDNPKSYRCYGFKVNDVPGREGKVVTIQNIHFYSKTQVDCNNKKSDEKCKKKVHRCHISDVRRNCQKACDLCGCHNIWDEKQCKKKVARGNCDNTLPTLNCQKACGKCS